MPTRVENMNGQEEALREFLQKRFDLEDRRHFEDNLWKGAEFLIVYSLAVMALGLTLDRNGWVNSAQIGFVVGTIFFAIALVVASWPLVARIFKTISTSRTDVRKKQ